MAHVKTKINAVGVLLALALGVASFALAHPAFAVSYMPLPSNENLNVPAPEGDTAIQKLENFLGPIARNLRIIIGAIAVLLIVISGFTLVVSGDNEETYKNQRKSVLYGVLGLVMISLAGPIAEIFDYRQGNFLDNPDSFVERAALFNDTTQLVVTFLKYFLGSLATLMFIRSGALMVAEGSNEEVITREKKNLLLGAAGLFLIFISDLVIRNIFYSTTYNTDTSSTVVSINQNEFVVQLVAFTNLMVSFVGPIMMFGIVAGGLLYVASFGNEERTALAKKIMLNSVIGVVIIYGAFALVSTVISGAF
jgi:hypothetical protein